MSTSGNLLEREPRALIKEYVSSRPVLVQSQMGLTWLSARPPAVGINRYCGFIFRFPFILQFFFLLVEHDVKASLGNA